MIGLAYRRLAIAGGLVAAACSGGMVAPVDGGRDQDSAIADGHVAPLDGGRANDAGPADSGVSGVVVGEIVSTEEGDVRGAPEDDLVIFKGIRYAEPPVGDLRWRPSIPHAPWTGIEDALAYGHECPQNDRGGITADSDEDCLTLNVWAHTRGNPRPVMVFIYGGGFAQGSSAQSLYEGSALARAGGVVVVSINYRLGLLGFMTTEALAAESGDGSVGNYGLRDQITALQWVQRDIAAFGGDPANVTIFGESAGGISVCSLIGSPLADGLYARGIVESGVCHGYQDPRVSYEGVPSRMDRGAAFVGLMSCTGPDELACMRRLDWHQIAMMQPPGRTDLRRTLLATLEYEPVLDGVALREDPIERLRRGDVDVPVILGTNADESRPFTATDVILTWTAFENHVRDILGTADGDLVIPLYPRADFGGPHQAYDAFLTDIGFACPSLSFARASASGEPTRIYYFTRVMNGAWGSLGAPHVAELFYVFGNFPGTYAQTPEDLIVRDAIQGAWTSFARGETPALTPPWPAYAIGAPAIAVLDAPPAIATDIRNGRCAELQRLGLVP